jgi:hypothetical protein
MPDEIGSTPSGNLLLAALPEPERSRFLACSRTVDLSQA